MNVGAGARAGLVSTLEAGTATAPDAAVEADAGAGVCVASVAAAAAASTLVPAKRARRGMADGVDTTGVFILSGASAGVAAGSSSGATGSFSAALAAAGDIALFSNIDVPIGMISLES
ncbi:hypothetical protein IHE31_13150 [Mycetohabitans rhizoxinica]|nr:MULTISPECIES: hypothetical protein [Mycetohabitans]MCG1047797.1 hypothetical protein [Mycetohabitans sp. B6]